MGRYQRDPVSELLDGGARTLLERAFDVPVGAWVRTRLADPSAAHRAWASGFGIDVDGPDNAPTRSGRRQDMRSRWGRAFARSLHYQLKWYGSDRRMRRTQRMVAYDRPMEIRFGRRMPARGIIPAGREVEIRLLRRGRAARSAVQAQPPGARIYDDDGNPGGRHSVAELRDWAQ